MGIDILTLAAARAGKGGGSASKYAQPEWGSETSIAEILPNTELTVDSDTGFAYLTQELPLKDGNSYTVTFNGVDYTCTASIADVNVVLGNAGAVDEAFPVTDEPFAIMAISEESRGDYGGICALVIPLDGSTSFALSIKGEVETVYEIPAKYTASKNALVVTMSDGERRASVTFGKIKDAVKDGILVYFKDLSGNIIPLNILMTTFARFVIVEVGGDVLIREYTIEFNGYVNERAMKLTGTSV